MPNECDYLDRDFESGFGLNFFACVDTINAIISGIWIAIQTPQGVRLFQIFTFISDAMCVGTLRSNCTFLGCFFLNPTMHCQQLTPRSVVQCLFIQGQLWRNAARIGPNHNWLTIICNAIFLACVDVSKKKKCFLNCESNRDYFSLWTRT